MMIPYLFVPHRDDDISLYVETAYNINKTKKDKSIPSWNDISSNKESEAQSADTGHENLMEQLEKEREVEVGRNKKWEVL